MILGRRELVIASERRNPVAWQNLDYFVAILLAMSAFDGLLRRLLRGLVWLLGALFDRLFQPCQIVGGVDQRHV